MPGKYKVEDAYALEERFATRPVLEPCVGGCDPDCFGVRVRGDSDMFSYLHVLIFSCIFIFPSYHAYVCSCAHALVFSWTNQIDSPGDFWRSWRISGASSFSYILQFNYMYSYHWLVTYNAGVEQGILGDDTTK